MPRLTKPTIHTYVLLAALVILVTLVDIGLGIWNGRDGSVHTRPDQAVLRPVRVRLPDAPPNILEFSQLQRISPRGNPTNYSFREETRYDGYSYFADVRILLPTEDVDRVGRVQLWMGGQEYSTTITSQDALSEVDPEFLPGEGFSAFSLGTLFDLSAPESLVPPLRGVLNYRGDLSVAIWALVRALALVGGAFVSFGVCSSRQRSAVVLALGWFSVTVLGFVLTPAWASSRPLLVTDLLGVLRMAGIGVFSIAAIRLFWLSFQVGGPAVTDDHRAPSSLPKSNWTEANRWYALAIVGLFALAFLLRMWNPQYMQGVDTFNLTAARAFNDTGSFAYTRNTHVTHLLAWLTRTFGYDLSVVRLPFVLWSLLAMGAIAYIARSFGRGAVSTVLLLYAISPVAIEKASIIREYGENLLFVSVLSAVLVAIYVRFKDRPWSALVRMTLFLVVVGPLVFFYGQVVRNVTLNTSLQAAGFLYGALLLVLSWQNFPTWRTWIVAAALTAFALIAVIAPAIGPFAGELSPSFNFVRFYFDPGIHVPMQWYSYRAIGIILPIIISLFALFGVRNRDVAVALTLAFWGSVLLFCLYMGDTNRSRYLFHIFPYFVLLMGIGLFHLVHLVWNLVADCAQRTPLLRAALGLSLVLTFWPGNTLIATRHEVPGQQSRSVTSLGNRNYMYELHEFMLRHGLTSNTPLVLEAQRPDLVSYLLDRPVTRSYRIESGTPYDIADDLYFEGSFGVSELERAAARHSSGMFLTNDTSHVRSDRSVNGTVLEFVGVHHRYVLYKW